MKGEPVDKVVPGSSSKQQAVPAARTEKKSIRSGISESAKLADLVRQTEQLRLQLEEARKDFSKLYEMSPVGYLVLDRKGIITRANQAFSQLINNPGHDLDNSLFTGLVQREDRKHFKAVLGRAMADIEKVTCEVRLAVSGERPPLDAHLEIIANRDREGGLLDILVAVVDISQRKQAEFLIKRAYDRLEEMVRERTDSLRQANQLIRENEEKFRTVADFTCDWEYWVSPDGSYRYISPSCLEISGYPVAKFMADKDFLLTISHPEDREDVAAHVRKTLESRQVEHLEFRIVDPAGHIRWISHSCQPVYDSAGAFAGIRASNRDISARKAMEEELAGQEKRLRLALDASSDGVWDRNLQTGEVFFGANWRRGLGYGAREEFAFEKLVHREDLAKVLAMRQACLSLEAERYEVEFRIRAKDGSWRWILSRGRVVEWDATGVPTRLVGTHTDITRLKEAEFKLAQAQAELEKRVAARTSELKETNIALRVLLQKRSQDKDAFEQQILAHVDVLVGPYLEKLEVSGLSPEQKNLLAILKENIREICSPFAHSLSAKFLKLTPAEVAIANLVKAGKSSKEIAEVMNLSAGTINIHRKNIRKKLGLTNQKSNLQTTLSQFSRETEERRL